MSHQPIPTARKLLAAAKLKADTLKGPARKCLDQVIAEYESLGRLLKLSGVNRAARADRFGELETVLRRVVHGGESPINAAKEAGLDGLGKGSETVLHKVER